MTERFVFSDLRELFAKANEEKSGDHLAGIAARSERERVAAKRELADLPLAEIVARPVIDPDEDDVSKLLLDTNDREAFREIANLTLGEFRELLLDDVTGEMDLKLMGRAPDTRSEAGGWRGCSARIATMCSSTSGGSRAN
jgi:ethanolamine ammonia-lyase large subunit